MGEEKSTREMICETSRDVKWICRTLAEMKETDRQLERKVRTIENWKSKQIGDDIRTQKISAGIGGIMGGFVSLMIKLFGL